MRDIAIYKIIHRDTATVYYVGQTIMPDVRMASHLCSRAKWVLKAQSVGHALSMEIIEWVEESNAREKEAFWIHHHKTNGANLANKQWMKLGDLYKSIRLDAKIHHKLHIAAAHEGCSIHSLAQTLITTGLAELLKRKAPTAPKGSKKGDRV